MATASGENTVQETTANTETAPSATTVDDTCIIASADGAESLLTPVIVEKPAAGDSYSLLVEPGKQYFLNFQEGDVKSFVQKDGDVTVTFVDGSSIILENFSSATQGDLPAVISFSDTVSSSELANMIEVIDTTPEQEEVQTKNEKQAEADTQAEQVAKVEPASGDADAQKVAQIEPAAGDAGGGGASRGGYGFNSSFDAQGVIGLDDVGPIGPTLLNYGVEFRNDILFVEEGDDVPNIADDPGIGTGVEIVDETPGLPQTVSGTVGIDFGDDGAGAFGATGGFASGYPLFSHGVQVITTFDAATGTYTGSAGGTTVFTMFVDENGNYSYTQFEPFDHADPSNPDDSVPLTFDIKIVDSDGDLDTGVIVVNVKDDGPSIVSDPAQTIDEATLGPVTINGDLTESFGEDGQGDIHPMTSNFFSATGDVDGGVLSSNGFPVVVTPTADGYIGVANGVTVFELHIDSVTGAYSFTLHEGLDHSVGGDTIHLNFGAEIVDYDGDKAQTSIVINVTDDIPNIGDQPAIGSGIENLDETNVLPEQVSGQVVIDFGGDGAGSFGGNNVFTSSYPLVSHGNAVGVTFDAGTNTYTGTANGATVFTLVIQQNGQYTYTQLEPFDHANQNNPNDSVSLNFGIAISDADGDSDTGNIVINVFDDAPTIAGDGAKNVSETTLPVPAVVNGNLVENFGEDGQGDIHPNGNATYAGDFAGPVLTSNGNIVVISATPTGYVGVANGVTVFEVTINATTGAYSFTLHEPLDHSAGGSTITLNFGAEIVDYDGDKASTNIIINVTDDVPNIGDNPGIGSGIENVDETNVLPEQVSGTVVIDFGNDGPGNFGGSNVFNSTYPLVSHGVPVDVTFNPATNTYTGAAGGNTVFTLVIQQNGQYTYTQLEPFDHANPNNHNDSVALTFGISITDADGDSDTGNIVINVFDDGPVANDDGHFANSMTPINGDLIANDSYGEDGPGQVKDVTIGGSTTIIPPGGSVDIVGNFGTLHLNSDGTYTYTPFGGIDGVENFIYTIVDYDGDIDTAQLSIEVDVDVRPIVLNDTATVDETNLAPTTSVSDHIDVDFGTDGPGTVTGNGGFTGGPFTSEGHAVTVTFNAGTNTYTGTANGSPVFTLQVESDGDYTFNLLGTLDHPVDGPTPADHNDSMSMQFGVNATDADGDVTPGTITINVLDDGPAAHNDVNNYTITPTNKDYNIVLILDVSGSMADNNKIATLKAAVANLLGDFNSYTGGEVKVHIVPFSTTAGAGQTFDVSTAAGFDAAVDYLNDMNAEGFTNYEAPMQSALNWLNGNTANDPIPGAETYTYFVSDGEPNRYMNGNTVTTGTADQVMNQIDGDADGSDEIAQLQNLSNVIALGIGVNGTTLGRLDQIDTGGDAIDVQDPNDLDAALANTNPITGTADGNVITGQNGGPGAADTLSQDDDTTVTQIAYNGTTINVHPVTGANIEGLHGTLHINADGSYTYTLSHPQAPVNNAYTDVFTYTVTDGDGDTSAATLTLQAQVPPTSVDVVVNGGVDTVCIPEDGQGVVPVHATYAGGDGDEIMTLTLTGVNPTWVITAPGWQNQGGGTYTLTLPAGQHNYDGNLTFKPPANSDVDMTGLNIQASIFDPDTGNTATDNDGFTLQVDAIIDTPNVNVSNVNGTQYWYYNNQSYSVPLNVAASVTDTDGSEQITKITLSLNTPFNNGVAPYFTLDDMGIGLNKGTEVSPGLWEIPVNAGNAAAALNGLALVVPPGFNYAAIHQNATGHHTANITVKIYASEVNLSGGECDPTNNDIVIVKNLCITFAITPLLLDLDRDGVEVVDINAGVMFDMTNDGVADHTSWVGADDGLLAIDLNNDGVINNQSELFGDSATYSDGFANLASYDSNADGVINAADEVFTQLQVWQDVNQDGVSQSDELFSLTDLGIVGINTTGTQAGYQVADSIVTHEGTFQWADGTNGTVADVGFNVLDGAALNEGVVLEGTAGRDIIYGTDNNDVLIGLAGNDILIGGAGDDIFVLQADGGLDVVKDFDAGDVLDVSGLIDGYDALQDSINDFVFSTEANGNTTVYVDASGSGDIANATVVATLEGVSGLSIEQITNNGQSAVV
jgi:T1SS-143 domain-containing protein